MLSGRHRARPSGTFIVGPIARDSSGPAHGAERVSPMIDPEWQQSKTSVMLPVFIEKASHDAGVDLVVGDVAVGFVAPMLSATVIVSSDAVWLVPSRSTTCRPCPLVMDRRRRLRGPSPAVGHPVEDGAARRRLSASRRIFFAWNPSSCGVSSRMTCTSGNREAGALEFVRISIDTNQQSLGWPCHALVPELHERRAGGFDQDVFGPSRPPPGASRPSMDQRRLAVPWPEPRHRRADRP